MSTLLQHHSPPPFFPSTDVAAVFYSYHYNMSSRNTRSKPSVPVFDFYSPQTVPISNESTCLDLLLPDRFRCRNCDVFRCSKGGPIPLEDRERPLTWSKYSQKRTESKHKLHICEQPHRADKYFETDARVRGGQVQRCRDVVAFLAAYRTHDPNLLVQPHDLPNPLAQALDTNLLPRDTNLPPSPQSQVPNSLVQAQGHNSELGPHANVQQGEIEASQKRNSSSASSRTKRRKKQRRCV
jgi:hypothetical protein